MKIEVEVDDHLIAKCIDAIVKNAVESSTIKESIEFNSDPEAEKFWQRFKDAHLVGLKRPSLIESSCRKRFDAAIKLPLNSLVNPMERYENAYQAARREYLRSMMR